MSKEKQIEEMARIICEDSSNRGECEKCGFYPNFVCYKFEEAERLYNAGFRKQSEGEWIDRDGKTWCSLCEASNKQYKPSFCPHCGARMKGE